MKYAVLCQQSDTGQTLLLKFLLQLIKKKGVGGKQTTENNSASWDLAELKLFARSG